MIPVFYTIPTVTVEIVRWMAITVGTTAFIGSIGKKGYEEPIVTVGKLSELKGKKL
jgi:hypothetical protein